MANERARELRNNATAAERKLWQRLRTLKTSGQKFRRQVPIDHFIADFACLSHRLIVEIDGATHGTDPEIARDRRRQRYLEDQGFVVLRFANIEIVENIDGVLDTIAGALSDPDDGTPTPSPSPQGGGE